MLKPLRDREHRLGRPAVDNLLLILEPRPVEADDAGGRDGKPGLPRRRGGRFGRHGDAALAAEDAFQTVPGRGVPDEPPQMRAPVLAVEVRVVYQGDVRLEEHVDPTGAARGQLVGIAVAHPDVVWCRLRRGEFGAAALASNLHRGNSIAQTSGFCQAKVR